MTLTAVPKHVTVRDAKHLKAVAALPCALWFTGRCFGDVCAHHVGVGGMALKSSDLETVPVCVCHHREAHDFTGYFAGWDGSQMKAWEAETVEQTMATLRGLKAGREVTW